MIGKIMRLVYLVDPRSLVIPRLRIPRFVAIFLLTYVLDGLHLDYQTREGHYADLAYARKLAR